MKACRLAKIAALGSWKVEIMGIEVLARVDDARRLVPGIDGHGEEEFRGGYW